MIACLRSGPTASAAALIASLHLPLLAAPAAAQDDAADEAGDEAVDGATEIPDAGLDEETQRRAQAHFERGTQAFEVGDYGRAAEEFAAAHELTDHPDLLFNVYSARERNGELVAAEEALSAYLQEASPDAERRDALEARLARLRLRLSERRAEEAEARARAAERARQDEAATRAEGEETDASRPPPEPPPVDPGPIRRRSAAWWWPAWGW
ncbi:MAG TPA: hypothetical protein RMH99_07365 [Sandaracinaceae bacterium LLY-WYZ-13_1]|nr:hypothetical protein [Sandaracinaceae bacterium LLY-WYZ-13_1]